jgi:two-component system chemotaxis response regulator CheB
VEALSQLVSELPADLPAAIFIVLHVSPHSVSVLPNILQRSGKLPAKHPESGENIRHGQIFVAPPDHHLLLHRDVVHVARGPRENGHRPAVDPLFRTAARRFGRRVIGVILSGTLDDGTAGLAAVKERGGVAVVQDPEDAMHTGMPTSAIENVDVDHILPLSRIASTLVELTRQPVEDEGEDTMMDDMEMEAEMAELEPSALHQDSRPGVASGFTCPECHGALFELKNGERLRFRCRVGHAYSADSLLAEQSSSLEAALWTALRALEETAALANRVAERAHARNRPMAANRFVEQAREAERSADVIRKVLLNGSGDAPNGLSGVSPDTGLDTGQRHATSGHQ